MKIKKKNDPLPQEDLPTPTPQVQEQEEQNVTPQAQVTHDPPQQASTQVPLVKHGRISKDHPIGQIIVYPHLMEDQEPLSPSSGIQRRVYH